VPLSVGHTSVYVVDVRLIYCYRDAYLGSTINAVGFDALYVQFCMFLVRFKEAHSLKASQDNNYCGLTNYNNPNAWNYASWYIFADIFPYRAEVVFSGTTGPETNPLIKMSRSSLAHQHPHLRLAQAMLTQQHWDLSPPLQK
jgi:hypothetical protein